MRVFVLGYPGDVGGANTECWHTVKLWREAGIDVDLMPTWFADPVWKAKLDAIGCTTHDVPEIKGGIRNVPNLPGSVVVGFCNAHYFSVYRELAEMKCRRVWLNCMTFWFPYELNAFRDHGMPEHLIFQSEYQRNRLEATYGDAPSKTVVKPCCGGRVEDVDTSPIYDSKTSHVIRGAFDVDAWPFRPTARGRSDVYMLGKIARADVDKWSSNLWPIYTRVQHPRRQAMVMGVNDEVAKKLGTTPDWANWLRPNTMPTTDYYRAIHCMLTVNGGAAENWPRAGLEAFASGVPVVAQNQWGWREQIIHGETGFLGDTDEELAHWAAVMAWDEPLRQRIVHQARERLVTDLANPAKIWAAWERVFRGERAIQGVAA